MFSKELQKNLNKPNLYKNYKQDTYLSSVGKKKLKSKIKINSDAN